MKNHDTTIRVSKDTHTKIQNLLKIFSKLSSPPFGQPTMGSVIDALADYALREDVTVTKIITPADPPNPH